MGAPWTIFAVATAFAVVLCCVEAKDMYIWPMPRSARSGDRTLCLNGDIVLSTDGSAYADGDGVLSEAFDRMLQLVAADHVVDGNIGEYGADILTGLRVVVHSGNDELNFGVDESYELSVPAAGDLDKYALIEANTVYGALHGLQTFSQMCTFNFTSHLIELKDAPWTISDKPRFPYRGLLIVIRVANTDA